MTPRLNTNTRAVFNKGNTDLHRYAPRCQDCHTVFDGVSGWWPAGESHPNAKLSDEQVAALRAARAAGESLSSLARRFGLSESHVWAICANRARRVSA